MHTYILYRYSRNPAVPLPALPSSSFTLYNEQSEVYEDVLSNDEVEVEEEYDNCGIYEPVDQPFQNGKPEPLFINGKPEPLLQNDDAEHSDFILSQCPAYGSVTAK